MLRSVGPGLLTGIANVDPSVVITATVVGAAFHFSLLWVIVLCIPFLLTVFAVSARIGYEARKGLVDLLRENYGRHFAAACALAIVAINMAMIIADLMAVSEGMSIILLQKRSFFVAAVAFTVWYFLIFRDYRKLTRNSALAVRPFVSVCVRSCAFAPESLEFVDWDLRSPCKSRV